MLGLGNYGSDDESDSEKTPVVPQKPKSSLSSLLPSPGGARKGSSIALPPPTSKPSVVSSLGLPPPKAKSKKRDGPIKITVEALKPAEDDEEDSAPQAKKRKLDDDGERKGTRSSALLAMLPAPKKIAVEKVEPPKILGGGAVNDSGVAEPTQAPFAEDGTDLSFLPAALRKPRTGPAPSISRLGVSAPFAPAPFPAPPPPEPVEEDDGVDFFSLGEKPIASTLSLTNVLFEGSRSTASTSKLPSSSSSTIPSRPPVSAAPKVKEFEPPAPTPYDPYPGYYQLPSGEWAAHDPAFYKQYWDSWQSAFDESGKRKDGKGWEGADRDDLQTVDALEELKKEQLAAKEKQKGLTAPPTISQPVPLTIKVRRCVPRMKSPLLIFLFPFSKRLEPLPGQGISSIRFSQTLTRTALLSKRSWQRGEGTGKRQATNTVRANYPSGYILILTELVLQ